LIYLNDLTLCSPEKAIAQDEESMGLHLNIIKCELISNRDFQVFDATLRSSSKTSIADASLLGASLFPDVVLDQAWAAGCLELRKAM
jgi:hypothetical protein